MREEYINMLNNSNDLITNSRTFDKWFYDNNHIMERFVTFDRKGRDLLENYPIEDVLYYLAIDYSVTITIIKYVFACSNRLREFSSFKKAWENDNEPFYW